MLIFKIYFNEELALEQKIYYDKIVLPKTPSCSYESFPNGFGYARVFLIKKNTLYNILIGIEPKNMFSYFLSSKCRSIRFVCVQEMLKLCLYRALLQNSAVHVILKID